jgi:catechol 2,3-dioxygenase-like lactoylglutathione lyase family enzyme
VRIDRLDHLVLTVADIDATVAFYTRVLGMEAVTFGAGRTALAFGRSKINLHRAGHEFEPKARHPTPGSADLCLIAAGPLEQVIEDLAARHPGRGGPSRTHRRHRPHPVRLLPRPRPEPHRGQHLPLVPPGRAVPQARGRTCHSFR